MANISHNPRYLPIEVEKEVFGVENDEQKRTKDARPAVPDRQSIANIDTLGP